MEIVLKQKDADFILNYLRSDLERLNTNYDEVNKNEKKIKDLNAKIDKECGFFEKLLLKAYNKETQEQLEEYNRLYRRHTDILIKCIELLTIGSTDDGDFNTAEILYCITPEKERVEINRYFAEKEKEMVEIGKEEYEQRKTNRKEQ